MKKFTITLILAALMLVSCSETKNPDENEDSNPPNHPQNSSRSSPDTR